MFLASLVLLLIATAMASQEHHISVLAEAIGKEFALADQNGDDRLSFEEVQRYSTFRNKKTSPDRLKELFQKADRSKDNSLNIVEIVLFYLNSAKEKFEREGGAKENR